MGRPYDAIKGKLLSIIKEMSASPGLFVKAPGRDFTRKRKLSFETMLRLLVGMGGGSLQAELLEHSGYAVDTATSSAFIQQRDKLLPVALEFMLHEFTLSFSDMRRYRGYRLLAVDGSDFHAPTNANEPDNFFQNHPGEKGFSLFHLNALYDLCNRVYTDALIQSRREANENKALTAMVDRSRITGCAIVIADRGYESYNNLAHIERKGWNYLIRIKDMGSNGILSGIQVPPTMEFDVSVQRTLTRKQTNSVKSQPDLFRFLPNNSTFDFLDLHENKFYPMTLRVVRFRISDNTYETVVTNLDRSLFPPDELKNLYALRWGIETSFRELKYTVGLSAFHSKKMMYIAQEVFAHLIMYNFSERIASHAILRQKEGCCTRQINFTVALRICRHFFRCCDSLHPPDVEALITRYLLPVRPGRRFPRNLRHRQAVSFLYRLA
jgi:hypothetical protein